MIKHSFSIIKETIKKEKISTWINSKLIVNTIEINDEFIEKKIKELNSIKTIWVKSDTNREPNVGLNYYGITIIPDNQIEKLTKIFQNNIDFNNKETFEKLIRSITNKNSDEILVHFGI
ncbi:MAG: hypothetical protein J6I85_02860 [Clostridia bacterium]|nr:hypothetical protein [Clostridia bacterium]